MACPEPAIQRAAAKLIAAATVTDSVMQEALSRVSPERRAALAEALRKSLAGGTGAPT